MLSATAHTNTLGCVAAPQVTAMATALVEAVR